MARDKTDGVKDNVDKLFELVAILSSTRDEATPSTKT